MSSKIPSAPADVELQLSTAISIGATTFSVASANDDDGVALPSAIYCFTIDNGSSNKEYLMGLLNGTDITAVKSVSRQGVETSGAVRPHRVGSPCIITDFATIQRVAGALNGTVDLDGANPIGYDAEPSLADRKDLATVGYVLDLVTGGTVTFDNQTLAGVLAGETITAGQSVYLKESDQRWWLTDADIVATVDNVRLGIALGAGTAGVAITGGVLLEGAYTTTGLTAGSRYYLGNTAGALTTTVGTNAMIVGLALSTTRLLFSPSRFSIPTFNEKLAMAGGGILGTPSTSNKFATEAVLNSTVQTFLNSGTYTKPTGLKKVFVQAWGGGASGASSTGQNAGGGGGGGYFERWIEASAIDATEVVTIGNGGGGVTGNTGGTAGGNTTFGSLVTAYGGVGGSSSAGSTSGGSGGDIQSGGSVFRGLGASAAAGGIGALWGGGGGGGVNDATTGFGGGNALYGGAGGGGSCVETANSHGVGGTSVYGGNGGDANATTGVAGSVPGGGGGGAGNGTSGAGGKGKIVVTEYYS